MIDEERGFRPEIRGSSAGKIKSEIESFLDKIRPEGRNRDLRNADIALRNEVVGLILNHEWDDAFIDELSKVKGWFGSAAEARMSDLTAVGWSEDERSRVKVSSWWNGVISEAVATRLWEDYAGRDVGVKRDLVLDRDFGIDGVTMVRDRSNRPVLIIMQHKGSTEIDRPVSVVNPFSRDEGTSEAIAAFDGIKGSSGVRTNMINMSLDFPKKAIPEVQKGFGIRQWSKVIPIVSVIGLGDYSWQEMMTRVENGSLREDYGQQMELCLQEIL